jgi:hypothetical protein
MVGLFELLGLVVIFAAIVLPVYLVIYFEYKNKRAMIEKGIVPEDGPVTTLLSQRAI